MKVYIGGVFDLFHIGHLNILERASKLGDVYVGVLTDEAASRYKPKPIIPLDERLAIIKAIKYVTHAFPQHDTDPTLHGEIQAIEPDILLHGDDWNKVGGQLYMRLRGKETIFLPYTKGISSTDIKQRILSI